MDDIDIYRAKLKEIADYAFKHGLNVIGIENLRVEPPNAWDENIKVQFYNACHDGFKIAQKLLIDEIKKYQTFLREATAQLKAFRRQRSKEEEKNTKQKIKVIEQRLHNFSHIADGIAWQLIGGKIHIARRFHIQENSSKFLDSSNLEHAIQVADEINKNPSDFALISDLTSFVQIGDLLVRQGKVIRIVELKEGKVNNQIIDFFEEANNSGKQITDKELKEKFDDITVKQIKRMQRQQQRAFRAADVINNDKGIDPVSGGTLTISTPIIKTEYYDLELSKLFEDLKEKTWAYTVVDNCVHIGMYRDKGIMMAGNVIEEILKSKTDNYIIIDWLSITRNLSQPLFAKPFPPDFIIDILTGRVKVIIGLDSDALIETFNLLGLKSRWLTEKETTKIEKESVRKELFKINKRGIVITIPTGEEWVISGGIISKILYDSIKPSNIALSFYLVDDSINNEDNTSTDSLSQANE